MSQHPSPWRVNDAVLYDALRDEFRSAIAGVVAEADGPGDDDVAQIRQLRSDMYSTDGFDRNGIASRLKAVRVAPPERSHD